MGRHKTRNWASRKQTQDLVCPLISASQSGAIMPFRGNLARLETFLIVTTGVGGKECAKSI